MMFIFVGLFLLGGIHHAQATQKKPSHLEMPDNLEVIVYTDKELQRKRSSSALRKESSTPQHRGLVTEFYGANLQPFANNGDSPTNQSTQTEDVQAQHKTQATQTPPLQPLGYGEFFEAFTPTRRGTLEKSKKAPRKVIRFTLQEKQPKSCCTIQ
jgi:hypothetical protein